MDKESRRLLDHARSNFERVRQRQLMFFGGALMALAYMDWMIAVAGFVLCYLIDYLDMKACAATLKARDILGGNPALQHKLRDRMHLTATVSTFAVIVFIVGCAFAASRDLSLIPVLFMICAAMYWAVFQHQIASIVRSRSIIVASGALVILAAPLIADPPSLSSALWPKTFTAACVFYFIHLTAKGYATGYSRSLHQIATAERSLKEIAAADQQKSDLLRILSHELRTPLNGVMGMLQLMVLGPLTEKQREQISVIETSGKRLDQLINEVMDSERLSTGQLRIVKQPVDLRQLIATGLEHHRKAAEAKGLRFEVRALTALPDFVVIDAARVTQCLDHLLSNAIKFTDEGFIRVSCAHNTFPGPPRLSFRIKDTGIGMTPETCARIFKRFSQDDMSESRGYGGMGLGLWISKTLAQLMGGGLSVASRPGVGSRFTLTLIAEAVAERRSLGAELPQRAGEAVDLAS